MFVNFCSRQTTIVIIINNSKKNNNYSWVIINGYKMKENRYMNNTINVKKK